VRVKNFELAIILCAVFFLFFLAIHLNFPLQKNQDYSTHFSIASGGVPSDMTAERVAEYPPLFDWLASFFIFRNEVWVFFYLFLFAFLTPLTIFFITKSVYSVWFYFSISSYFYFTIQGLFPQGLIILFVLLMFASKNLYLRLLLVLLGILTHSTGIFLMPLVLILIYLKEYYVIWKVNKLFGCVPMVPIGVVESVGSRVAVFTYNDLIAFLLKVSPIPFCWFGLKWLWKNKEFGWLVLFAISFLGALFYSNRIIYFTGVICVIGFSQYFEESNNKKWWLVLSLIWFVIEFWSWVQNALFC